MDARPGDFFTDEERARENVEDGIGQVVKVFQSGEAIGAGQQELIRTSGRMAARKNQEFQLGLSRP